MNELFKRFKVFACGLIAAFILFALNRSLRWQVNEIADEKKFPDDSVIFAFWHGRQLMLPPLLAATRSMGTKIFILISAHFDGRVIASAISYFGYGSVAGSSTRGGKEASLILIDVLAKKNQAIGITPDGPKGPIYKAKFGAIKIAQKTGKRIIPLAYGAQNKWTLRSWDKMIIPKPFSKAVCYVGPALTFTPEQDPDQCLAEFEAALNTVIERCDAYNYSTKK